MILVIKVLFPFEYNELYQTDLENLKVYLVLQLIFVTKSIESEIRHHFIY